MRHKITSFCTNILCYENRKRNSLKLSRNFGQFRNIFLQHTATKQKCVFLVYLYYLSGRWKVCEYFCAFWLSKPSAFKKTSLMTKGKFAYFFLYKPTLQKCPNVRKCANFLADLKSRAWELSKHEMLYVFEIQTSEIEWGGGHIYPPPANTGI